jgi:F-type H+-transporting ATPase subunit alpha
MLDYLRANHGEVLGAIRDTGKLDDDTGAKLIAALDAFKDVFQPASGGGSQAA